VPPAKGARVRFGPSVAGTFSATTDLSHHFALVTS